MQIVTAMQKKAIGVRDIRQELMTSGLYRYFRHPTYTGMTWTCLGVAVMLRNPDGLLAMPLLAIINLSQAVSEERNDMITRYAEKYRSYKRKVRMFGPIWLWGALFLSVLVPIGCATTPKLTPEDRKRDIEYLAQWARDYSPFVKLAEKYKGNPSYEALLPKYLEWAEQAQSNEEFYLVVKGYYDLICSIGHHYLMPESQLKWGKAAMIVGIIDLDINPWTSDRAFYWSRLGWGNLSTRAHPPFHIAHKDGKYLTDDDWQADGVTVPQGSQIIRVNGMNCTEYLDYLKENTSLRYNALSNKGWIKNYLLIIDEGGDFKGWQVDFLLPDNSTHSAFVPKIKGFPKPKKPKKKEKKEIPSIDAKENCTCIELTDEVGYIRVKRMMLSELDFIFTGILKKDRKIIEAFLDRSEGKYTKLIIDIRNNDGGNNHYGYENLIRPFLDEPVTYSHVAGIRRKYRDDLKDSVLKTLRMCSRPKDHVISTEEVGAPEGFDPNEWVFYKLTRRIKPANRYNFDGDIYVLINGGVFSAADDYANAVKRMGFATLVGQNTAGGCAAYIGPPVIRLPASGMIFRVETEIVINPDGSINELVGTPPDVRLASHFMPKSITKKAVLENDWVKRVINEL
jgi:hypothetical protein